MTDLPDSIQTPGHYEVGYGKPPKASQFKPGNTFGKGKKKGSKNLKTIVNAVMAEKVSVKIDGGTKKISKMELLVLKLANAAISGDPKAATNAIALIEKYEPITEDNSALTDEAMAYNLEALKHYLTKHDGGE